MFGRVVGAGIGALIGAIWDDDDENVPSKQEKTFDPANFMRQFTAKTLMDINRIGDAVDPTEYQVIERIARETKTPMQAYDEARMAGRVLYDPYGDVTTAEKHSFISKYGVGLNNPDDEVSGKTTRIYDSIDPADDADSELEDAFSFETEIENLFGPEQMSISQEDIAPETSILDLDITEPTDEISQSREVTVSDETISQVEEIEQIEETTPFEEVFYPDETDLDMDPTDDFDDVLYPREQYDISDTTEDFIQWPEQELDDMADELDVNIFESAAWVFDQDMAQEALTGDDSYQDIGQALDVIDFEDFLDDTTAITLDLVDDHMGIPFFQWISEPPGGETLDIKPF